MAASLGLGVLFNGYLCRASEELPAVRAFLEAGEKPLQMCLLLGRPAVSYPVSYTHLEVYKRQALIYFVVCFTLSQIVRAYQRRLKEARTA